VEPPSPSAVVPRGSLWIANVRPSAPVETGAVIWNVKLVSKFPLTATGVAYQAEPFIPDKDGVTRKAVPADAAWPLSAIPAVLVKSA
jgi:hypothetical protein